MKKIQFVGRSLMVDLSWENKETKPGAKNSLKIKSTPNSICALSVVDESLKLISESANVDEDAVFKAIEKFEIKPQFSEYCSEKYRIRTNGYYLDALEPLYDATTGISSYVDSLQAFDDFGVVVITDLTLETRPCIENEKVAGELMNNLTSRHSVVKIDEKEPNSFEWDEKDVGNSPSFLTSKYLFKEPFDGLRSFFPETWIWDVIRINSSGEEKMEVSMPHTLTTWNSNAICLSPTEGLGISKNSKVRAFKPFFIDFSIPKLVKRKEILHLQVLVFNYLDEALPIKLSLTTSGNFVSKSEEFANLCVEPKTKSVHIFPVEAIQLGETKIQVGGKINFSPYQNCDNFLNKSQGLENSELKFSDTVIKKTTVIHEGFPVETVKSGFICGEIDNFENSISWNIKLPADIVESSVSVSALVSGDLLGPAFQNTNNLITLPTGCGEQNMILLVPNLLLLEYFLLTKSKDSNLIETALKNLDKGYQQQLKYRKEDGSYSAFGEKDEKGSIWLTAFVVRYLSQAQKFIHVDRSDLKNSVRWITKNQLENGCFPVIGKFYHQDIKKKILEEDSSKTLTAYILISLIESGMSPKTSMVIKNAIFCLKGTDESAGLYGDLMTAYALLLAGEKRDAQTMITDLLGEAKRSYRMLWWESEENSSVESNIEMTAYGILSLLKLGGPHFLAAASDAIRWITQYRNQNGGFLSTQDTIVALEAIAKFSEILPKTSEEDNLSIKLQASNIPHIFNISNENRMLQQSSKLESLTSNVTFNAEGKGCALVQTMLRYHTRRGAQSEKFKVNIKIDPVSEVDVQSIKKFHVCVRYKGAKEKINMAVLEIFMVSGFYPDRSSLYDINISHRGVRMWEEYEDRVHFYFEDLKNKKICVQFLVKQETCVENASPALIKLYDYYNTQYQSTIRYNLQSHCNQSQTWLDSSDEIKNEAKRELKPEDYTLSPENFKASTEEILNGFQDIDFDLETPQGGNGIMPVFALPPPPGAKDQNCPLCLTTVPDLFQKMYCSSQAAVKVFIRGKDIFDFRLDLTPRRNQTVMRRTVYFTMKKDCECAVLNSVNSYALLLVTPPRTLNVNVLQEMHLDSLTQLYTLEKGDELPKFVTDAINYCKNWKFDER